MRADIKPGATFPDYELPDHMGRKRKLSFLQGDDPMIVTLLRGMFCPKDRHFLHSLVEFSPRLSVGYATMVSITTDNFMGINELRQGVNAQWPFLYDEKRIIQKDLEVQEYTDPMHDPMIPYTFVLEPGLKIFKIYNGYWYWGRPTTHELHMDLRQITEKIRVDWKIDTPEMRKKWEKGDTSEFFPYGLPMKRFIERANWEFGCTEDNEEA